MFKRRPLIVFEGIEGSGKTTLINHISKILKKKILNILKFVNQEEARIQN